MKADHLGVAAETRFNDLQAGIEFGSRLIDQIHHRAARLRDALKSKASKRVADVEAIMAQLVELKACVLQQRGVMRDLRHDVRAIRGVLRGGRKRAG